MVLVDSREKWTQNHSPSSIRAYFRRNSIDYVVQKLDCGDYMLQGGNVTIDRKKNLDELAKNLLNPHDKARFFREVQRAKESGLRLIILCEHGNGIKKLTDILQWRSKYGRVTGKALANAIYRTQVAYGVTFLFCDKRSTPKVILSILGQEDK